MAKNLAGYHLLIAEDNPTNQIVVAKIIEQLGGSFDLASDGVEAIQLFDPKKHHLALLDIEMPRKSGLEVIKHIRERTDTPSEFPIVALTAFVLSDHRAKIRDAGANAILAKPIIDINEFGQELVRQLDSGSSDEEIQSGLLALQERMGAEVMPELLTSLSEDLAKQRERLENLVGDDCDELVSIAHALKSLAGLAGDEKLSFVSETIEAGRLPIETPDIQSTKRLLMNDIDILAGQISEFQKGLTAS